MAVNSSVQRGVPQVAMSRVLEHLHRKHRDGRRIFPLTELSEATAIDMNTAEEVMRELETTGPYDVIPLTYGETRWRVEGCVYDLDGWQNTDWNTS